MTNIDTGVTGAKRQSWRDMNPRKLLREIIEEDPKGDEAKWRETFWERISEELGGIDLEGTYSRVCILYWLDNNLNALLPERKREVRSRAVTTQQAVVEAKERTQALLLLHLITPNGKPLGQCTGADCKRFGGWYSKLAALVPARKCVAEVLSEQKLRQVWNSSSR